MGSRCGDRATYIIAAWYFVPGKSYGMISIKPATTAAYNYHSNSSVLRIATEVFYIMEYDVFSMCFLVIG